MNNFPLPLKNFKNKASDYTTIETKFTTMKSN